MHQTLAEAAEQAFVADLEEKRRQDIIRRRQEDIHTIAQQAVYDINAETWASPILREKLGMNVDLIFFGATEDSVNFILDIPNRYLTVYKESGVIKGRFQVKPLDPNPKAANVYLFADLEVKDLVDLGRLLIEEQKIIASERLS